MSAYREGGKLVKEKKIFKKILKTDEKEERGFLNN